MTDISALIFDLDGTLVHSAPDIHAAVNMALRKLGRETLDLPTIISFIGNGIGVLTDLCLKATGGTDSETHKTALAHVLEAYQRDMTTLTRPYPGVRDALEDFHARGVPMAICTNKPAQAAVALCAALDLARFFDVIAGAEDGQPRKPDAAPLLDVITRMGAAPQSALYVGDSKVDYDTAANAGVAFRLFNGGYLNHPLPDLGAADRFEHWSDHGIAAG
ncbi:phosphoglycolate phosphatase [Sulfitobacter sp. JB4-11]|uniref:phosphoglycolate phosphatase n=1 Tax=Sulfitobacter rhodophyticola TaxID=3238304 RepID=UPI00351777B5